MRGLDRLRPDDELLVYHGAPEFRVPELINGFDATRPFWRSQGSLMNDPRQGYAGLYVTTTPEEARRFGGGAVIEIRTRAEHLHGTNWDGETDRDHLHRDEFPASFRPYLSKTLSQPREPQALLKGVVEPHQITRIWTRTPDGWREWTREQYLDSEPEFHSQVGAARRLRRTGLNLQSAGISLDDWIRELRRDEGDSAMTPEEGLRMRARLQPPGRAREAMEELFRRVPVGGSRPGEAAVKSLADQAMERFGRPTGFREWMGLRRGKSERGDFPC